MTAILWQYFFQDDVDAFKQYLADATYAAGATKALSNYPTKLASSPAAHHTLGTPPSSKTRKSLGYTSTGLGGRPRTSALTRAEINARDSFGRTLLHYVASSSLPSAMEFMVTLLDVPFIDLYIQDTESGWTPLHRALYFGNIAVAHALMLRDVKDATDYTTNVAHHVGGLVKIKDHEGNSPFEVFGLTIAPRVLQNDSKHLSIGSGDEDGNSVDLNDEGTRGGLDSVRPSRPMINLQGDEAFSFGSNKNLSLGLGDEDDRQYPERLSFERPEHLLRRLHDEHTTTRMRDMPSQDLSGSFLQSSARMDALPAVIQNKPILIQDVVMSKMHTAVLTADPISNLYICGFGPGGRLGTGDEATRFKFVSIQGGSLAHRRISAMALGQDHSIAIGSRGEVFTWGSNKHGQLGYTLPEVSSGKEIPMQLLPRQLYGHVKKEVIVGAAASAIHSAIFTSTALYTFGKNEGQLGLMDSDARSLDVQIIPRQVGVSVLRSPIQMVTAIDRATSVLLENHEVFVFTHYGFTKVVFQLEGFTNYFISERIRKGFSANELEDVNSICKLTSGGNTICALSTFGEVFTVDVNRKAEATPPSVSTTNPTKAKNALPAPLRLWSIKKAHMAAIDVAVGQDSSVIICTAAGSVWRKEKRAKIQPVGTKIMQRAKTKDYKFVRIPNLTRAIAVRSNAFGAFTAIRKDCDVTREQMVVDPPQLWEHLFTLLPFHDYRRNDEETVLNRPRFWTPAAKSFSPSRIKDAILISQDPETDFVDLLKKYEPLTESQYDMCITSNVTEVRIPMHSFLLKARSSIMRHALAEFQSIYYYSIPDVMSIEYGSDGQIKAQFQGADFLTLMNLVLYLYTDNVVDVWHHTSRVLQLAPRYRQIRTELMKIASNLDMPQLERAVRVMVEPVKSLYLDFDTAVLDADFFYDADILIELAGEVEVPAHSVLLCARCPFFNGLFHGRASGRWMSSRRTAAEVQSDAVRVDLKHIDVKIFEMVLRHIYADIGDEIFDDVVTDDLDDFIDLIIELMSVANELMLDRLAQICQKRLGTYVNTRNVCQLLNTVAESSVNEFKHAALEYICLNLEGMLEQRLLEELDPDLLLELCDIVRQNQLAFMPFARSSRAQDDLIERYSTLTHDIELAKQRRVDSMQLRSRLQSDDEERTVSASHRSGSSFRSPKQSSPAASPALMAADAQDEEESLFEMDEDRARLRSPGLGMELPSPTLGPQDIRGPRSPSAFHNEGGGWLDSRGRPIMSSVGTDASSLAGSLRRPRAATPPAIMARSTDVSMGSVNSGRTAWKPSTPAKIGLKDIMDQASTAGVSNLTEALRASGHAPVRAIPKMSQKERKKQQQIQMSKEKTATHPRDSTAAATVVTSSPASPWQKVSSTQKPNLQQILQSPTQSEVPATTPLRLAVQPAKTGMTMRQTVSGTPPTMKDERAKQVRSVSTPSIPPSNSALPQIQSIRHTPVPASSSFIDAHTSMADILAQQQTEKIAVKEAVAKRSLQEIQQEQEFQQWWDAESRRIQEEEEGRSNGPTAAARRGKSGRGRGGRGGRRGGARGVPMAVEEADAPHVEVTQQSNSGRGGRRGRGGGAGARGARSSTS